MIHTLVTSPPDEGRPAPQETLPSLPSPTYGSGVGVVVAETVVALAVVWVATVGGRRGTSSPPHETATKATTVATMTKSLRTMNPAYMKHEK